MKGHKRVKMGNNGRELHSRIQAGLSAERKHQLEEIAANRQITVSAAIREAMREYLARDLDKPARFGIDKIINQVNATKRRRRASPRKGAFVWLSVPGVSPAARKKAQRLARTCHCSVSVLVESLLALEHRRRRSVF